MKPKVFVAMRFGSEDTDEVYDRSIKSVIRSLGFTPVRIDRKTHNDYIDRRILKEIESSHLAVVDLTYARPSVYYEAGYAEAKGLPVVYTARVDHLNRMSEDSLRVHFDLSMKPVVSWEEGQLNGFEHELTKRLRLVSRPIVEMLEVKAARLVSRDEFRRMSGDNRTIALRTSIRDDLLSRGYLLKEDYGSYATMFEGKVGRYRHYVSLHVMDRFLASKVDELRRRARIATPPAGKFIREAIVISENSVSRNVLDSELPSFESDARLKQYFRVEHPSVLLLSRQKRSVSVARPAVKQPSNSSKCLEVLTFVDGCKSLIEAVDQFQQSQNLLQNVVRERLVG